MLTTTVLVWILLIEKPDTRTEMQVIYLGKNLRKLEWRSGESEIEKQEKWMCLTKLVTSVDSWVLIPQGPLRNHVEGASEPPLWKRADWGLYALDYPQPLGESYSRGYYKPHKFTQGEKIPLVSGTAPRQKSMSVWSGLLDRCTQLQAEIRGGQGMQCRAQRAPVTTIKPLVPLYMCI